MTHRILLAAALAAALPATALADTWTVDPGASSFGFISVKNAEVAEEHSFGELSGAVTDGKAEILISLASVETQIDIRNERMRDMLFHVEKTPTMTVTADIDLAQFKGLAIGERETVEVDLTVNTGAEEMGYFATLNVTRVAEDAVTVSTAKPIAVHAGDLGYADGIEALRDVAGLESISLIVPVSFDLMLKR